MATISTFSALYRVVWSGTLPNDETFSHHVWIGSDVGDAVTVDAACSTLLSDILAGALEVGTVAHIFSENTHWDKQTTYAWDIATNKRITAQDPVYRVLDLEGADATGSLPNQVAWAVTMRAEASFRWGKNRGYWPGLGLTYVDDNLLNNTVCDGMGLSFAAVQAGLLEADPQVGFVVYSPGHGGLLVPVDMYIGNRVDTVKRRVRKIVETRYINEMTGV